MTPSPFTLRHAGSAPVEDRLQPLGQILLQNGTIREAELDEALSLQRRTRVRLGEILVAHGWAGRADVAGALADQHGFGYVDLQTDPPEAVPDDIETLEIYLKHRALPWRRVGGIPCYVTAEPGQADELLADVSPSHGIAFIAVSDQRSIDQAALRLFGTQLAIRAAERTPRGMSVRSLGASRWLAVGALLTVLAGLAIHSGTMLALLCAAVLLLNFATLSVRALALMVGWFEDQEPEDPRDAIRLADRRPLPRISVLVPLYREASMVRRIQAALEAIDYPRELLDVKLLLEERDTETRLAADLRSLPPWVQVLVVPDGAPRTKPRAMNAALDFCDGEIIGILDAEDRPDPGQLMAVAEHLRSAPPEVACVQCRLAYFNASENWITRCFETEYAIWFSVLMRGFQRLGLPIPLGGTSVYFRRSALRDLQGWDAHNVTEDADLGMRLARRGMRCAMLTSTTEEEANCRLLPWIRQRSRWLKGYMLTWLNHMRDPVALWRDLGTIEFLGLNVLFLGGAVTYLALPVFWAAIVSELFGSGTLLTASLPDWLLEPAGWSLLAGQVVMLSCASLALYRRKALGLLWILPTLPIYWTIGALAAWKAMVEVIAAPYYWDKTRHGVSRFQSKPPDRSGVRSS